jgi:hypothetical protein
LSNSKQGYREVAVHLFETDSTIGFLTLSVDSDKYKVQLLIPTLKERLFWFETAMSIGDTLNRPSAYL